MAMNKLNKVFALGLISLSMIVGAALAETGLKVTVTNNYIWDGVTVYINGNGTVVASKQSSSFIIQEGDTFRITDETLGREVAFPEKTYDWLVENNITSFDCLVPGFLKPLSCVPNN